MTLEVYSNDKDGFCLETLKRKAISWEILDWKSEYVCLAVVEFNSVVHRSLS